MSVERCPCCGAGPDEMRRAWEKLRDALTQPAPHNRALLWAAQAAKREEWRIFGDVTNLYDGERT